MARIAAWEDDPLTSDSARPISRPEPPHGLPALSVVIPGRQPAAARYEPGTPGFRYWNSLDALTRASTY
jgi:hypothetical protein